MEREGGRRSGKRATSFCIQFSPLATPFTVTIYHCDVGTFSATPFVHPLLLEKYFQSWRASTSFSPLATGGRKSTLGGKLCDRGASPIDSMLHCSVLLCSPTSYLFFTDELSTGLEVNSLRISTRQETSPKKGGFRLIFVWVRPP